MTTFHGHNTVHHATHHSGHHAGHHGPVYRRHHVPYGIPVDIFPGVRLRRPMFSLFLFFTLVINLMLTVIYLFDSNDARHNRYKYTLTIAGIALALLVFIIFMDVKNLKAV